MSLIDFAHLKNFFQKKKKKLFFQKKTAISHKKIIALACCRILGARVFWGCGPLRIVWNRVGCLPAGADS